MRKFSVAPMMACTDRHYRYLARLLSRRALLYTEMVTQDAVLHGDCDRLLGFDAFEHPVALQLGGNCPDKLSKCVKVAEKYGYVEVNLNVGCPSDRVQCGEIGACLMKSPERVAECVAAMKSATDLPITVKTRIGVDDQDSYELLQRFVQLQVNEGVDALIVHARKAWLQGLSPRENRQIPPLDYERVYQIKRDFPDLEVIINGGLQTFPEIHEHLQCVDGVMLGRAAYHNLFLLADVDSALFGDEAGRIDRIKVIREYLPYLRSRVAEGVKLSLMTRHLLGLFHGVPGGKKIRGLLSSGQCCGFEVLEAYCEDWDQ